jgi:hypothetical protein
MFKSIANLVVAKRKLNGVEQRFLGREVAIEQGLGYAGGFRQFLSGRRFETLGGKNVPHRANDGCPALTSR